MDLRTGLNPYSQSLPIVSDHLPSGRAQSRVQGASALVVITAQPGPRTALGLPLRLPVLVDASGAQLALEREASAVRPVGGGVHYWGVRSSSRWSPS